MNHIVIFCDKTTKEKHDKIDQTDCILKTKLEKAEYDEIRKTIASNETEKKYSTSTQVQEIQQQP